MEKDISFSNRELSINIYNIGKPIAEAVTIKWRAFRLSYNCAFSEKKSKINKHDFHVALTLIWLDICPWMDISLSPPLPTAGHIAEVVNDRWQIVVYLC